MVTRPHRVPAETWRPENVDAIRYGGCPPAAAKAVDDADYTGASTKLSSAALRNGARVRAGSTLSTRPADCGIEGDRGEESRMPVRPADRPGPAVLFGRHDQLLLSELAPMCARYPLWLWRCSAPRGPPAGGGGGAPPTTPPPRSSCSRLLPRRPAFQAYQVFQRTRDNFVQELGLDPRHDCAPSPPGDAGQPPLVARPWVRLLSGRDAGTGPDDRLKRVTPTKNYW